ncbi:PP2C family protein-serine/threonine phosphatase [Streptomyces silvisoli]|uniref:PP2C family protein-serine/threonine phosphatase n=1 Tax=Streptomyces silvisoli TaxID=3034235 RepID=A0ABT5ZKL8_9ACTN|nr:PP2C family protein-serine/threonine phosphatase [Streptomyces silvisoli]MDF3290347.1 PP2C family protein-serine/threonine phosphatase [Streptomyces silvisoli]
MWSTRGKTSAADATAGPRGVRNLRWLPALLIVISVIFDVSTPPQYSSSPLLAAAPAVAAALLSQRGTVLVGCVAVVVDLILGVTPMGHPQANHPIDIANVAIIAVVAVYLNHVLRSQGRLLVTVSDVAVAAQRAVLPHPPTRLGPLRLAARYVAAQAKAQIGGDVYVVQETPYGVRLVVADVRGKGMGAVSAVAVVVGAFRELADTEPVLGEMVERLEDSAVREARRRAGDLPLEGFVTAVVAEIHPDDGRVRIINRGHPAPLLLQDGTVRALEPAEPDVPFGMGALREGRSPADAVKMVPGSTLLFMTDGVTEARDRTGAFYDPVERLTGVRFASPDELVDTLLRDVARHAEGRRQDDIAVLAVSRSER